MKPYICGIDPRGIEVICSEKRWNYLTTKHPELIGLEQSIEEAIESPKHGIIYASNRNPEKSVYYGPLAGYLAEIRVIVSIITDSHGEITTAHPCSKRPDGEKRIWPP